MIRKRIMFCCCNFTMNKAKHTNIPNSKSTTGELEMKHHTGTSFIPLPLLRVAHVQTTIKQASERAAASVARILDCCWCCCCCWGGCEKDETYWIQCLALERYCLYVWSLHFNMHPSSLFWGSLVRLLAIIADPPACLSAGQLDQIKSNQIGSEARMLYDSTMGPIHDSRLSCSSSSGDFSPRYLVAAMDKSAMINMRGHQKPLTTTKVTNSTK